MLYVKWIYNVRLKQMTNYNMASFDTNILKVGLVNFEVEGSCFLCSNIEGDWTGISHRY